MPTVPSPSAVDEAAGKAGHIIFHLSKFIHEKDLSIGQIGFAQRERFAQREAGLHPSCNCPDFETRGCKYKHIWAMGGLYQKMFGYFQFKRDEFLAHYHQRSNVETTVMMVKTKFGDSVNSKSDVAAKNEVLCKILCHNICCLISAFYELGLDPTFAKAA